MPSYQTRVRTPWPAAKTFEYLSDMSRFDEWDPGTKSATVVSGTPGTLGATYDLTVALATLRYRTETLDNDAPTRRMVAVADTAMMRSVDTITVRDRGEGAEVTYEVELEAKSLLRFTGPVLGVALKRMGDKGAHGLANKIDGQIVSS